MKLPTRFVLSVLLALSPVALKGRAAEKPVRTLLFVGGWGRRVIDWQFAKLLDSRGFRLGQASFGKLTPELLRRYHAAVVLWIPHSGTDYTIPDETTRAMDMLVAYARDGGGLWVNQSHGQQMLDLPCLDYLSKPFGLAWPMAQLDDPSTRRVGGFRPVPYGFTREIGPSPVSRGVTQIWYPTHNSYGSEIQSLPLALSKDWTPVVMTGPEAVARVVDMKRYNLAHLGLEQERRGKMPIFAVRTFGKGRVAACSISPPFHLYAGNVMPLGGIAMRNGMLGKKGDLETLVVNTLTWLADAGRQAALTSTVVTPANWLQSPHLMRKATPFPWAGRKFGPPPNQLKGVFGCRTTYSVGKATADEYVAAAGKLGRS